MSEPLTYKCPRCGKGNAFVNQCGCDPHNLPTTIQKVALRRAEGYPIGHPAPLFLLCPCGRKVDGAGKGDVTCADCGQRFDGAGWLMGE